MPYWNELAKKVILSTRELDESLVDEMIQNAGAEVESVAAQLKEKAERRRQRLTAGEAEESLPPEVAEWKRKLLHRDLDRLVQETRILQKWQDFLVARGITRIGHLLRYRQKDLVKIMSVSYTRVRGVFCRTLEDLELKWKMDLLGWVPPEERMLGVPRPILSEEDIRRLHELLDRLVSDLGLSDGAIETLDACRIKYTGELVEKLGRVWRWSKERSKADPAALAEIIAKLGAMELEPGMDTHGWVPPEARIEEKPKPDLDLIGGKDSPAKEDAKTIGENDDPGKQAPSGGWGMEEDAPGEEWGLTDEATVDLDEEGVTPVEESRPQSPSSRTAFHGAPAVRLHQPRVRINLIKAVVR